MNTKQPELTIFQNSPSIHVDNNQMRIEEEEAIQDQKRRQVELQLELEREFGNISENDDKYHNDSMNSTRYNSRSQMSVQNHIGTKKDFPLRDDFASLKNLVETKSREIEAVSNVLAAERKQFKNAIDEYEKRITIAESEKERALMNRNQSHELLVEHKGKINEKNEENEALKSKIKVLQNENEKLVADLESTKLMLSDVQTKYNMVEKNVLFNADRNTDLILKQAQERHNAQIAMMQQQIENFKSKYDDLEHEHKHLDIRYKELQRSRESMLIEKSEIINQLNRNLEESQRQCQDMLSRPDLSQENGRLKSALQTHEYQKEEMSLKISKLQKRLQEQTTEMEMMDSIIHECDGNNQSFTEISKFVNRDPLNNVNNSTPLSTELRLAKVKEELCKSLNNIKMKREEIKILEKQIVEKDKEIAEMKSDESKLLIDLNKYRDEAFRLSNKQAITEKELEKALDKLNNFGSHHTSSNINDDELQAELSEKKQECEDLISKIGRLTLNENKISEMLKEEQSKFKQTQNELNEMRKKNEDAQKVNKSIQINEDSAKACEKCNEYLMKIAKLELSCLEMQNTNADYLSELNNMKQDLFEAHQNLENIEAKLTLQNLRDKEIEKLKDKAKEFENFMRTNNRKDSVSISPEHHSSSSTSQTKHDASTETCNSDEYFSNRRVNSETQIRDEMARIFATQIKTLEKQFVEEAKKLQNEIVCLNHDLEVRTNNLQVAAEQLELLKFTIVHEREEFEGILKHKEEIFKNHVEKYNSRVDELNEKMELIEEERLSIETLKKQIDDERRSMKGKQEETLEKLKKLQHESTEIIEELKEKYKTAKKTALNYKQYSDDKEKHYRNECERIKNGYSEAVDKIQNRVKDSLQQKEDHYKDKMKKIEQEFEFKIEILKGMLEKAQKQ